MNKHEIFCATVGEGSKACIATKKGEIVELSTHSGEMGFPSIISVPLKPEYDFIINASTGIWNNHTNEEAVSIAYKTRQNLARRALRLRLAVDEPRLITKLVENAVKAGYDNVSCVIVSFKEKIVPIAPDCKVSTNFVEMENILETSTAAELGALVPLMAIHVGHWKHYLKDCELPFFDNIFGIFHLFISKLQKIRKVE